ncbi:MAG: cob(I)yrinic acid a,c-diamide adenosyltransferase [Acidobacteriota bacterium]
MYTKTGDKGETGLVGGQRVPKDAQRIAVFGTVDELNSFVGLVRISASDNRLKELEVICERVQHELFNLGSVLATLPEDLHPKQPRVNQETIAQLERDIDQYNSALPPLRSFVLPGGSRLCAELHVCRTICRRAERELVTLSHEEEVPRDALLYLNRLSDAFFVWSRWVNQALGVPEALWQPNKGAR